MHDPRTDPYEPREANNGKALSPTGYVPNRAERRAEERAQRRFLGRTAVRGSAAAHESGYTDEEQS
jgi:hypothetical protein